MKILNRYDLYEFVDDFRRERGLKIVDLESRYGIPREKLYGLSRSIKRISLEDMASILDRLGYDIEIVKREW